MAKKSLARNYIYNLVYEVLILILPLITTPYLSRVLGAEKIGIYTYTYNIVQYFILFGSLGVALYGQREIAYAQENKSARKKTFIEIAIFRFVTIFLSVGTYYFFFMRTGEYSLYYKILLFELIAAAFDISWFFQGIEEFKRTVTRNVLVRICSVSLVFLIVKTPEDLAKFTLIYSLADFLGNLSLWFYLPKYLKGGERIKGINPFRHLPFIIMLFIPQIANKIYNILDTTMIGKIVADKTETGFYEQGQKVIRLLLTIVTSLGTVMVPRMASTFATGDKKKINDYMNLSFNFVFFLAFPITFGIVSISDSFVPVFFGAGYDKVALLIKIISPIILLMGLANVVGTQFLLPTKRQKEFTISVTIGVIANFIMNYILIHLYSSIGACIATVLSQLIVDIVQFICIRKDYDLKNLFKLAWKYLVSALVMFGFCLGIKLILNIENIRNYFGNNAYLFNSVSIITQAAIGALIYFIMLIVLKDDYVYKFLNRMKEKILGKLKKREEN